MPDFALTLIAPPGGPVLTRGIVIDIHGRIPSIKRRPPHWLAPSESCEIGVEVDDEFPYAVLQDLCDTAIRAEVLGSKPIDMALLPVARRRKRLLVADMESTIIQQECLDELADYVGLRSQVADITDRAMRGELDFETALVQRVALLKGLDARILDEVYEKRVSLMQGAETLLGTMKAEGAFCALVSGGFTFFTEKIAKRLGFDTHQANSLEIADGKLTGRVQKPILGRAAKLAALEHLTRKLQLEPDATMAVGDGANDLDMLKAAGLGVAFRAKPKVQKAAASHANGAVITHGDLTALLYLQGYSRNEFAD